MRRICGTILALACLAGSARLPALGAPGPSSMTLLFIDGTKTFASTVRVGALAVAIRATGVFDLSVCFTDQERLNEDPMSAVTERPAGAYDVVVVLPRDLDDGTSDTVWIVTEVLPWTSPEGWGLVELLSDLIDGVFAGSATAVDPTEDLWPALLATTYRAEGWLR